MGEYDGPGWYRDFALAMWAGLGSDSPGVLRGPSSVQLWLMAFLNWLFGWSFSVTFQSRGGSKTTFVATTIRRYTDKPLPTSDSSRSRAWLLMGPASEEVCTAGGGPAYHCMEYSTDTRLRGDFHYGSYALLTRVLYSDRRKHPSCW
ncbi:MAG TPA: hypothetical protein VLI05_04840 [Candidatus Saccharimonadia bacterium]|nr:hypothetical protein [Candidatus Saccharimonadia bacterium]